MMNVNEQTKLVFELKKGVAHWPIDDNVWPLVMVLNAKGFVTLGSCGGHEKAGPTQQSYGSWFVTFEICDERKMDAITKICNESNVNIYTTSFKPRPTMSGKVDEFKNFTKIWGNTKNLQKLTSAIFFNKTLSLNYPII